MRNCTRDEGGPFGFGNQELIPSHRDRVIHDRQAGVTATVTTVKLA